MTRAPNIAREPEGIAGKPEPKLRLCPVTQREAKDFVAQHHRHNEAPIASVFQVGVCGEDGVLLGVAMCERPKARMSDDGRTLEVSRTCTTGARNANSMLYGACWRAATALGYTRLLTYTLPEESGASLKAAGWKLAEQVKSSGSWAEKRGAGAFQSDLFGERRMPVGDKLKWEKTA